jgi:hypothetical protein
MGSTYCFVFGTVDPNWNTGDYGETLFTLVVEMLKFELCYDLGFSELKDIGLILSCRFFCTGQWNCCNASKCKREGSTPSSIHRVDNFCMHAGVTLLALDIGVHTKLPNLSGWWHSQYRLRRFGFRSTGCCFYT